MMASTKSKASTFALVAWDGKNPTWSIVRNSFIDGVSEPGKRTRALWGTKKYACEILAVADKEEDLDDSTTLFQDTWEKYCNKNKGNTNDETDFGLMNVTSTASGITKQQQRHPTKTISDTEKDLYRFQTTYRRSDVTGQTSESGNDQLHSKKRSSRKVSSKKVGLSAKSKTTSLPHPMGTSEHTLDEERQRESATKRFKPNNFDNLLSEVEDTLYNTPNKEGNRASSQKASVREEYDSNDDVDSVDSDGEEFNSESDNELCDYEKLRQHRIKKLDSVKNFLGLGPSNSALMSKIDTIKKQQQILKTKIDKLASIVSRHNQILSTSSVSPQAALSGTTGESPEKRLSQGSNFSCNLDVPETQQDPSTTVVCGRNINKLKLATALIQPTPQQMALKLMACLFTKEELANGTPTGCTTSKEERRIKTVKKLNPPIMQYIEEKVEAKWPGGYKMIHRQVSQKCVDTYNKNPSLRH